MSITGRNWGNATLDGATMMFAVGSKPAFRIPLKDVNQVQQNKEEVSDLLTGHAAGYLRVARMQTFHVELRVRMSGVEQGMKLSL